MNELGVMLLWLGIRATVLSLLAAVFYGMARRRGPAARSQVMLAGVTLLAVLPLVQLSPWPRWWTVQSVPAAGSDHRTWSEGKPDSLSPGTPEHSLGSGGHAAEPAGVARPSKAQVQSTSDAHGSWASLFFTALRDELTRPVPRADRSNWRWIDLLAIGFLAGVLCAAVRVALGLWAVRGYRRRSRPIEDRRLLDEVDILRARMGCVRLVELRESIEIATPATVGWRRPLILLPSGWREWTELERRVVLAHELAHICRQDYLGWFGAQVSLALHFYHPLVHWLVQRLRLEQELAADAWGAAVCGGSRPYLVTLAQMALREDDRPVWLPARAFLPTRGMFLRRIAMLRDTKNLRHAPLSFVGRALVVGGLALGGLLVAAVRGPAQTPDGGAPGAAPPSAAQVPGGRAPVGAARTDDLPIRIGQGVQGQAPAQRAGAGGLSLDYVPLDAVAVLAARVGDIVSRPDVKPLVELWSKELGGPEGLPALGVPLEDVEQITVVGFAPAEPSVRGIPLGQPAVIMRARAAHDWKQLAESMVPEAVEQKLLTKAYYKSSRTSRGYETMAYFRPDDRTIVLAPQSGLERCVVRSLAPKPDHPWAAQWKDIERAQVAAFFDVPRLLGAQGPIDRHGPLGPLEASVRPLWTETQHLFAALDVTQGLKLNVLAGCRSEAGAESVAQTLDALLVLARNLIQDLPTQLSKAPAGERAIIESLVAQGIDLLASARIERERMSVRLRAESKREIGELMQLLTPTVLSARQAAQHALAMNNLKQLALAMHNYHDVYKAFPPAVRYGPDGKTPHSWRVAILPFVERVDLYNRYRFDEPWDGPNNRQLIDQLPEVFAAPSGGSAPGHTAYFVLTGEGTVFSGREGTRMQEILDGSSNTVLMVEAKRSVPWTKPEDIAYAADQPAPKLGGFYQGGFHAAFCDGAVRFISEQVNDQMLRALITRAGGEAVAQP